MQAFLFSVVCDKRGVVVATFPSGDCWKLELRIVMCHSTMLYFVKKA